MRISRHTSMPDTFGSITSSSTRSGCTSSNTCKRLGAVAGDVDAEALPSARPTGRRRRSPRPRRPGRTCQGSPCQLGLRRGHGRLGPGRGRESQGERRALAQRASRPGSRPRGWWPRGARWRARGRCRRSGGCGPGRRGRSARRCARGRRSGCRCRGLRPRARPCGRR